jgi:acyl-coenzyme A thioesterase PaaI-like protein
MSEALTDTPTAATPELIAAFAPLKWAQPYLASANWVVQNRTRGADPNLVPDRFCEATMRSPDAVQAWLELYQKPLPGTKIVIKTLSLIKFGNGLHGLPGICHGGATLTLMDEGLAFAMVANIIQEMGHTSAFKTFGGAEWVELFNAGKPPQEVLRGRLVTAKLDIKFLRPVLCPGIVGIEVEVGELVGSKMTMKGVMRDAEGKTLMEAEGLWIRIGGGKAKL